MLTVVVWTRSYQVSDELSWCDGSHRFGPAYAYTRRIVSASGGIMFQARYEEWGKWAGKMLEGHDFHWFHARPGPYPMYQPRYQSDVPQFARWAAVGFEIIAPGARPKFGYFEETKSVTVPYWAIIVVTALPPFFSFRSWRRRRLLKSRLMLSLCGCCGYDLRATPLRCPECGAMPKTPSVSN
jgi:hypothetical protein